MTALPAAGLAMSGSENRSEVAPQLAQRALMAGVDRDLDAHAGAQRKAVPNLAEGKPNRDALHHLDPVAGGILRRQQRNSRAAGGRELRVRGGDEVARIGVDGAVRRIAFPDIGELSLLDVVLDVE